jgi:MFS family permease
MNNNNNEILRNTNFVWFMTSRFFMTLGLQIQVVLLSWHAYSVSGSALSLAWIGLAEAIPCISVALFAGDFADRYSRKKMVLFSMLIVFFTAIAFSQTSDLKMIYFLLLFNGLARGIQAPAFFSLMGDIVDKHMLISASSYKTVTWNAARISGGVIAGILLSMIGVTYSFYVEAGLIFCALIAILFIKSVPNLSQKKATDNIWKRIGVGLNFVYTEKIILAAISLDLLVVLFGDAISLLPIYVKDILQMGPEALGWLRSSSAVGSVVMGVLLTQLPKMQRLGKILLIVVTGFAISMIGFALSPHLYLAMFFLFISGALDSVSVVIRNTIVQVATPDEMRGRVASVSSVFVSSSNEIGAAWSGLMASLFGLVPSILMGGGFTLLIVCFFAIKAKKLRSFVLNNA